MPTAFFLFQVLLHCQGINPPGSQSVVPMALTLIFAFLFS